MPRGIKLFMLPLALTVVTPAMAAKKPAKPAKPVASAKAKAKPGKAAPPAKDERKKPAKTLNLITQYRIEFHKKDLPTGAAAGCSGRGDFNCRVDDNYQQTIMVSKKMNPNVTALLGGIYKYNLTEDKQDNVTWIAGVMRTITRRMNGSVTYVSNNRYTVFENAQLSGDSDTLAFNLGYKAMEKKKGMRDSIDTSLTFAASPGFGKGGSLSPKVGWTHEISKRLNSVLDGTWNFDMSSQKNRTSGTSVAKRNSLNIYGWTLKYQLTKKFTLDGAWQIKDFATGPSDNVFRFTLTRVY